MCTAIYKCVKYISKIKEAMLIFLVIDFVFPSNLEVLPCSSYYNGWTHTTCKKKQPEYQLWIWKKFLKFNLGNVDLTFFQRAIVPQKTLPTRGYSLTSLKK